MLYVCLIIGFQWLNDWQIDKGTLPEASTWLTLCTQPEQLIARWYGMHDMFSIRQAHTDPKKMKEADLLEKSIRKVPFPTTSLVIL